MKYIENELWKEFYEETDQEKRFELYKKLSAEVPDDGANELRETLINWRYHDPKKPDKMVDKAIWEMIVMSAHLHGVIASASRAKKQIEQTLANFQITEETRNDEVLSSAIYWEIRNCAKRFYATCESPQYGRKLFGMMESSRDEKIVRLAGDVYNMSEAVAKRFHMEEELKVYTDALTDEFFTVSPDAKNLYYEEKYKGVNKKFPIIL